MVGWFELRIDVTTLITSVNAFLTRSYLALGLTIRSHACWQSIECRKLRFICIVGHSVEPI